MRGRGGKRDQGQFEEGWDQVCDNLQIILIDFQIVTIFLLLFSRDREELLMALQKDIERRRLLK